jgi:hypothetical protein
MREQKSLRLSAGFEAAQYLLSFAGMPVRYLNRIVEAFAGAVVSVWRQCLDWLDLAPQFIHCPTVHCVAMSRMGVMTTLVSPNSETHSLRTCRSTGQKDIPLPVQTPDARDGSRLPYRPVLTEPFQQTAQHVW